MTASVVGIPHNQKSNAMLPFVVTVVGAVCLWKVYRRCCVSVHPNCVTVVYETRRRAILATSLDKEDELTEDFSQLSYTRPLMYVLGQLLYRSKRCVIVPPTSFFGTFTLPRLVLNESGEGEALGCTVENVHVKDGCLRMVFTLRYCIPLDQLERYLAAVGPVPPNESIAVATASTAKARGADLSVGLIINKAKRNAVFLGPFKDHLASKLMSSCAVKLLNVIVESVEIAERSISA